jgi:hypothetical protein
MTDPRLHNRHAQAERETIRHVTQRLARQFPS